MRVVRCSKAVLFVSLLSLSTLAVSEDEVPLGAKDVPPAEAKEAKTNTQFLLGNVLKKTEELIEKFGNFSPYGAALFRDGSIRYVWYAKPGEMVKEPVKSLPVIRRALQTQALSGKIVGSAVVYKYMSPEENLPQLNVELEYQTGLAMAFATEMTVDADRQVVWGGNVQANIDPRVFIVSDESEVARSEP